MSKHQALFDSFKTTYQNNDEVELSFTEYLDKCAADPFTYATAQERMLKAIGEPVKVDTKNDPRLSIIHQNRVIKVYPAFSKFYGMESVIEQVVSYLRHAAQGLEERKQVLYLLGPVGGGKSSIAERIKALAETFPIYALKAGKEISPIFESPLGLLYEHPNKEVIRDSFGIDGRYLNQIPSPWAVKRLKEFGGDISQFKVVRLMPSRLKQIAISKTEPGDENNQDISALVGTVDIRKLERYSQHDPDAYSYSGSLCLGNQGVMEFVEMFKAPIKVLHPLLTATQEGNYNGTQQIGAIPFSGIVLAHSNESEWKTFRNNKNNEAFLDRIKIVKVPYCLHYDDEIKIYEKMLNDSTLVDAPRAPYTLKMMSQFSVLSRLSIPENSSLYSKMMVYNGENMREVDPKAKTISEYLSFSDQNEGMDGISTRFAFKILSDTFNFDSEEIGANPVHLMYVLEQRIEKEQFPAEVEARYKAFIKDHLAPHYLEYIGKEIRAAYLENSEEYGQDIFDRYVLYADHWVDNNEYVDVDTGAPYDREALNRELEAIEKSAGISNPKDFRNEVVKYTLRYRSSNEGRNPNWRGYAKMRDVVEQRIFANWDEMAPIISFDQKKRSKEHESKHIGFIERMQAQGYTPKQTRLLTEYYLRTRKAS